jgi:hypothetical protein
VRERERERLLVCASCLRERERAIEGERVIVCACLRESDCVYVCVCDSLRGRERERVIELEKERVGERESGPIF